MPGNDSLNFEINKSSKTDSFEVFIGSEENDVEISEGSYVLEVVTKDDKGNYSLPFNKIFNIYGDKFRSRLFNRILSSNNFQDSTGLLSLYFLGAVNNKEVGVEIYYTDSMGFNNKIFLPDSAIGSPVEILNVDPTQKVSYSTLFLPEPNAIDTFYTEPEKIEVIAKKNVALKKNVIASDLFNDTYIASNAVDGKIEHSSRWLSSRTGEHWLEIDFEQEYTISGFKIWTGSKGDFNEPNPNFMFDAEINGEWINIVTATNNSNPKYETEFPEVTTSKVRYFVPEYDNNMVRLYEIEVYSMIRF